MSPTSSYAFSYEKRGKEKNNTDDLAEMIDNPPDGMSTIKWRSLVVEWKKEEWQKKSEVVSNNRKQSTRVAHTGGSASMTTHTRRLESYDQIMHRKYGEDPMTQPYFDVDSWMEATGPCKKGRVFGLSQHTCISSGASSECASSMATSNQMARPNNPLVQEMHQLKNDMQKMSSSLEMIQQILQTMTTIHPSTVPSSSASEHLGSSERNPATIPLWGIAFCSPLGCFTF